MPALHLKSVTATVYRAPIDTPVTTAFGTMTNRPMVLVRAEDRDGAVGWGEVWCNFPQVGAEHRARLLDATLAPLAVSKTFQAPRALFEHLTTATSVLALQSGEPGPFAQVIAGIDLAVWDLTARRTGKPLWRYLGGTTPVVRVYASGLNPTHPERLASAKRDEGYRAFKLKVGFGRERDIANLQTLRETLGTDATLMIDANQGWSLNDALAIAPALERFDLKWLEEPLRADRPWSEWAALQAATGIPLAAGENISGTQDFDAALATQTLTYLQPDAAKWGGISGCKPVAEAAARHGAIYCPHYLGGGIGLLASAHLLAAVGGPGLLEIDSNPNPLRTRLCSPLDRIIDGAVTLTDAPGLGIEPDLSCIEEFRVPH